jgi:cytoskeletal protein CcmA (bactofilin family)
MFINNGKRAIDGSVVMDEHPSVANTIRRPVATSAIANEMANPQPPARTSGVPSIISADMTIRGNLKCAGRLQIEGTVLGDIEVGQLIISDGAMVQGEIDAQDVEISGALTGLIRAREISLKSTARVIGDLHHEVLAIDPGAQLEGQCRRLSSETDRVKMTSVDPSLADRPQVAKMALSSVA